MSATWFDHAIATVAPRMAARRVIARQAFETLTRGYDGAARGRRTEGWRAPGSSADTEIGVAWRRTKRDTEQSYLRVRIDDPAWPQPLWGAMMESTDDGVVRLLWRRDKPEGA